MSKKAPLFSTENEFYTDLFNRYAQSMANTAFKFGATEDNVEDILQDSITRIYMHHDTVSRLDTRALISYIWHTVRSVTVNSIRDNVQTVDLRFADRFQTADTHFASPEEQYLTVENKSLLARSLDELPEKERDFIIEKYYLGWTAREISQTHNTTEGNVRIILMRARDHLKRIMEKEE